MDEQTSMFNDKNILISPRLSSPRMLFIILLAGIFLAEVLAMIVIYYLKPSQYWIETLLDATIMVVLIFPVIYYLHFRVLIKYILERNRSERLLIKVLENLPVGVWITDQQGGILHGNPASKQIWAGARYVGMEEYSEYKAWWYDSGKRIEPEEWAASRAILHGEASTDEEIKIECFDRTQKVILNSAVPFYEQGEIQGAIVVNQDITARKLAEQELKKSEALFKTAFQILPVGAWLTDNTGKIIYANPAGQEIWAGAHYVGIEQFGEYKGWWLKTGKLIEPEEWAVARAVKNGETSLNEEIEIECFDGTHKIILNSAIPVRDQQRQMHGVFVVNQDITERIQYEQALLHSNELIEKAFNSVDVLIAYLDRNFNFIRVNQAYARSAGYPIVEFIGKNHFEMYPHEENLVIFQRVVDTGETYSVLEKPFEYAEYPERGVTYWNWSLQPVIDIDGAVQGVVLSLVDVTERKRNELLLEQQNQELKELSLAEQKHRQLAETLNAVSLTLTQTLSFEKVMETLLDYASRLIPSDIAYIVISESEASLSLRAIQSSNTEEKLWLAVDSSYDPVELPFHQEVISTQRSLLIRDTHEYTGWIPILNREETLTWLGIPILTGGRAIGVLALADTRPDCFNDDDARLAEAIVAQASVAIQNAWLFEQVRAGHERLQTLSRRLVEVQESERRYIARELHDEASQALTALMFGLNLLEQDIGQPENLLTRVTELKQLTDGVLEDLHRLAIDLRPASLDYLGLAAALEQMVKNTNERCPMNIRFKTIRFSQDTRLPDYIETSLYRIVQEALTNAVRHSQANNIDVILELREGQAVAMVEDDGIGFDINSSRESGHLGLLGIQERAQMLAGALEIESKPGGGTTIVVEAPYGDTNIDR